MPEPPSRERVRWCARYCDLFREAVVDEAFSVLGCPETAEDVAQDVFVWLLERWNGPSATQLTEGYFRRAARRRALSIREGTSRMQRLLGELLIEVPDLPRSPFQHAAERECLAELEAGIAGMPGRRGEVARLTWVEWWSVTEIARHLGISVKRVERYRQAARAELRRRLARFHAAFERRGGGARGVRLLLGVYRVHTAVGMPSPKVVLWGDQRVGG